ncbi:MAG: tRNA (adenosine(37)-N6)-threonylcarbamoyltransferase complex ATPase subunit type 1 TsaE [Acidimicrobiales bacterium]
MSTTEVMARKYTTRTAGETRQLAAAIVPFLAPGDMMLLNGTLGAGKTTFVQGLAESLGFGGSATSPTFALAHYYKRPASATPPPSFSSIPTVSTIPDPSASDLPAPDPAPVLFAPAPASPASPVSATPALLVHVDLYRMERFSEVDDLGLEEALEAGAVVCIEWGAEGLRAFKEDYLVITIEPDDEYRYRTITLDTRSAAWERRLGAVDKVLTEWEHRAGERYQAGGESRAGGRR